MDKTWYPITLFYNGANPACAGDVAPLKRIAQDGRLEFVDCSAPGFDDEVLAGTPLRRDDLMKWIYARDAHGRWHIGIGALQTAYRAAY